MIKKIKSWLFTTKKTAPKKKAVKKSTKKKTVKKATKKR